VFLIPSNREMRVIRRVLLVATVAAVLAYGGFLYEFWRGLGDADGEIAQKREWSVLQGLAVEYQMKPKDSNLLLVRNALQTEYVAVGLPLRDQATGYAWLLANPSSNPRVKLMPGNVKFKLSRRDLERLRTETALDGAVAAFLEERVSD
jgi:hypothetical protein